MKRPATLTTVFALALVLVLAIVILRSAWLSDDAYITFRTVDNLVHGRGLGWNADERVQAYTHPLWMLTVSAVHAVTREMYYTCVFVSLGISMAAVLAGAFRIVGPGYPGLILLSTLLFSKSFVDYSTSGLENPLTHLLLALFFTALLHGRTTLRSLLVLAFIASGVVLNRLDTILLVAPSMVLAVLPVRSRRALLHLAIGFLPLILWEMFSLFYYGSPVPNTAYAKLNAGVPRAELVTIGFHYLVQSLRTDPVTLLAIASGLALATRSGSREERGLAAGVLLYLAYVVLVGGDFMSGRFLSAPLFVSTLLLARHVPRPRRIVVAVTATIWLIGFLAPHPPPTNARTDRSRDDLVDAHGIADERAFYYPWAGFLSGSQDGQLRQYKRSRWGAVWAAQAAGVRASGNTHTAVMTADAVGYSGYYAGPEVHIIDRPALADALLSKLPVGNDPPWRVGHYFRTIPEGYVETLSSGINRIRDPDLAAYWDRLTLVVRGDLWSMRRLREIWNLNLGRYDHLLEPERTRLLEIRSSASGSSAGSDAGASLRSRPPVPTSSTWAAPGADLSRRPTHGGVADRATRRTGIPATAPS